MADPNAVSPHLVVDDSDDDLVFDLESDASSLPDPGVDVLFDAVSVTDSEVSDISLEGEESWREDLGEEFRAWRRAQELEDGAAFRALSRLRSLAAPQALYLNPLQDEGIEEFIL
jgi:hypothetical protein